MEGLSTFLKELSHPYKNWQFIVNEARSYSLDYFHLLKTHPRGDEAAKLLIGIFQDAIQAECLPSTKMDAVDNLLLYLQKIIKESKEDQDTFAPVVIAAFRDIRHVQLRYIFSLCKKLLPTETPGRGVPGKYAHRRYGLHGAQPAAGSLLRSHLQLLDQPERSERLVRGGSGDAGPGPRVAHCLQRHFPGQVRILEGSPGPPRTARRPPVGRDAQGTDRPDRL